MHYYIWATFVCFKKQKNRNTVLQRSFNRKEEEETAWIGQDRLNPDIVYVALNVVLLNINSSIKPSYLKDRTV